MSLNMLNFTLGEKDLLNEHTKIQKKNLEGPY